MSFHIAETQTQLLVVNGGSSSINFSVFETLADQSLSAGLMARSKALERVPKSQNRYGIPESAEL